MKKTSFVYYGEKGVGTWNDEEWTTFDAENVPLQEAARAPTTKNNYHLAVALTKLEFLVAKKAFATTGSTDSGVIIQELIQKMIEQAGDRDSVLANLKAAISTGAATGCVLHLRQDTKSNHVEYFFEMTKPKLRKRARKA